MTSDSARTPAPGGERGDLLSALTKHRWLFTQTLTDLTEEQAAARTTVSELCLGGLVKHVAQTEAQWADFAVHGAGGLPSFADTDFQARADSFRMLPGETVAGVLADYAAVAARTDELVRTLDLDLAHDLPEAPWFEPGRWSARRVFVHVLAEVAQHAGHADLLREAVDGRKSMG
ncbi:DinB family protein [Kineococcus sp. NBC_00420]|uniref:DinB family protein n=1 Tax=Kineococcus sp. NBC_00420 TaxID=2903564 RepID=UPI002E1D509B